MAWNGHRKGNGVKRPVHPVLGEIGNHQQEGHLQQQRQRGDCRAQCADSRPVKQDQGRLQGGNGQNFDQQRIQEEVGEIKNPMGTEDGLGSAREEPFEGNEDRWVEEQIENEEIQSQPRGPGYLAGNGNLGAAEQRRDKSESDADEGQSLIGPQERAQAAEKKWSDESNVDNRAKVFDGVKTP
jgi:hypothetical protein